MRDMEKPKAPQERESGNLSTNLGLCGIYIYTRALDSVPVRSIEEAEMLVFALSEWIEYKRQLELWEQSE
jgi:hypothetical protein